MSLTDGSNMVLPVAPAYGSGGGMGFGGDMGWLILIVLFALGGFGGGFGGYGAGNMLGVDFPWLMNGQQGINANTNAGFDHIATQSAINGLQSSVTSGFGDVQTALCGGFAGVNATVNGAQTALSQQLYANQIADLERSFASQTANTQGLTALQAQLASCCCDNRQSTADVKYTLATEACATRATDTQNTQAILTSINQGFQSIKDQLCSDKIEQKNDTIAQLRSELLYARGQASQDVQTATIQAGQRNLANEVEQYVLPTPRPAYLVANPNCCYTGGCSCGM